MTNTTTNTPKASPGFARPTVRWRDGLALSPRLSVILLCGAVVLGVLATLVLGPHGIRMSEGTGDAALVADTTAKLPSTRGYQSLSIGRVDHDSISLAGLGSPDSGHKQPPGADTRYELGSVTKTFTAMLLADSVDRGEIALDDPLEKWIGELRGAEAGSVTIAELAEQRSGLPRLLPSQLTTALIGALGTNNPYDMGTAEMIEQTKDVTLSKRGQHGYSNLGVSLLGEALVRAAGSDNYPALATQRLLEPLGMTHTTFAITAAEIPVDGVRGHRENGRLTDPWFGESQTPAGCCTWTTSGDMTRYAQALLDGAAPGMTALEPRSDAGNGRRIGMIWLTDPATDNGSRVVWHNGGTGGGSTWLGLDRDAGEAVVVLGNSSRSVDELGKALLIGESDAGRPIPPVVPGILLVALLAMAGWLVHLAGKAKRRSLIVEVVLDTAALAVLVAALGPWQVVPGWAFGVAAGLAAGGGVLALLRGRQLPWGTRWNTVSVVVTAVIAIGIAALVLFT